MNKAVKIYHQEIQSDVVDLSQAIETRGAFKIQFQIGVNSTAIFSIDAQNIQIPSGTFDYTITTEDPNVPLNFEGTLRLITAPGGQNLASIIYYVLEEV